MLLWSRSTTFVWKPTRREFEPKTNPTFSPGCQNNLTWVRIKQLSLTSAHLDALSNKLKLSAEYHRFNHPAIAQWIQQAHLAQQHHHQQLLKEEGSDEKLQRGQLPYPDH